MYYRVYKSIETHSRILPYSKGDACLACPNALPNSGGSAGTSGRSGNVFSICLI